MESRLGPIYFKCPSSLQVAAPERSTFKRLLDGPVFEQRGPRARRQWSVDIGTATPQELALLGALVDGFYGPPPWVFVGPMQMVTNLFSPEQALLDPGTYSTGATITAGGAGFTADGLRFGRSLNVSGGVDVALHRRDGVPDRLPVAPNVPFTASVYGSDGARIRIDWVTDLGGSAGTTLGPVGSGSWTRRSHTATPPANAASAQVVVVGATGLTLPASTWTTDLAPWSPGKGANRVAVDGLAEAVQIAVLDDPNMRRGSTSFTIQEIG